MSLEFRGEGGPITVPESVLLGIAVRAAESVEGIRVRRRRAIDLDSRTVRLSLAARRDEPLLELAGRAQEAVAAALLEMCGIDATVEVAVVELE